MTPYIYDRESVIPVGDIVAVIASDRPGARSVVIRSDNSLHFSTTRIKTWRKKLDRATAVTDALGLEKRGT